MCGGTPEGFLGLEGVTVGDYDLAPPAMAGEAVEGWGQNIPELCPQQTDQAPCHLFTLRSDYGVKATVLRQA